MIRLLVGAGLAAGAAAFILFQLQGTAELALWEILLLLLVFVQYRDIPDREDPFGEPLFRIRRYEPLRLPRGVASVELAVVDATTGYLTPDHRLRPALQRIAEHRLGRQGLGLDSAEAVELIGEKEWRILMNSGDESVNLRDLESLVSELEKL